MQLENNQRFSSQDVEIRTRETAFDGFLKIERLYLRCRLFEGGWSGDFCREVLHREPGVGVLLYDPLLDMVLMVEQFRVGCLNDEINGPWPLELVAGLIDAEENAQAVAVREVGEEAGLCINGQELLPVHQYYNSPGGSSEKLTVFCTRFDARTAGGVFGLATESENIRTVIMTREEARIAMEAGRINNAMSIIALQWLELNMQRVRQAMLGASA